MSGIAAVIRFDGGPVEAGAIERMTRAMAYRGPDGIAHWRRGSVALGHCAMHATAEATEEVQPLASEDENLVLVMDGWLSNWIELRSELLARGTHLRTRSDAELVLRAYETWGDDCPRHLDGEYALVVWDARRQEAFCARDHAGMRPLHYHWNGRCLVVASDVVGVLAGPRVQPQPNPGMIAQYVAAEWYAGDETPWTGVMRARGAHRHRFGARGARVERSWHPPTGVTIRHKRDEDYAEHYRGILAEAVRRAARSHAPLACEVSGGLDSSAVFAMAHSLLRHGTLPAPGLYGYTLWFEQGGGSADEIDYARAVARHVGADVREVPPFLPKLDWFLERARADREMPLYPNGAMSLGIARAAKTQGCRVILNGLGGDEWLSGSPIYYAQHLANGDFPGFLRSWRHDSGAVGWRKATRWAVRHGVAELAPQRLIAWRRRARHRTDPGDSALSPALQILIDQYRTGVPEPDRSGRGVLARRDAERWLADEFVKIARDRSAQMYARAHLETRSPLYARELIEFSLSIPEWMKSRGITNKYLHRMALNGLLPAMVLTRSTKAEFSIVFTKLIDSMDELHKMHPIRNECGFLHPPGVTRLYQRHRTTAPGGQSQWQLWGVLGAENVFARSN